MTDLELEVIKLRWRVQIMEKFFMALWSSFMDVYAKRPPQEFSDLLSKALVAWQEAGETALQDPEIPEDRRAVLLDAFAQEIASMKESFSSLLEVHPQ